jgi:hypothetical protein
MTAQGIHPGIPELTYHSDTKTLSASGAKTLLRDPERFAWERDNGRPPKAAFDLGGVVHALVLRSGDERIRVIDAYDWKTKAAQEARKTAHAAGLTPINRTEFLQATEIARAVRRHPLASSLFTNGKAEVSLYWTDPETGVSCRARVDWLRDDMIVDLKTARYGTGTADTFGRQAASFNYPLPAAVYTEAVEALTGKTLPFITVTVETSPPYLVRAYRYTDGDLDQGRAQWHEALREFAAREKSGDWTVPAEIDLIALPAWYAPDEDMEC